MDSIQLTPIAFVHNDRPEIRNDFWGSTRSRIVLCDDLPDSTLDGLEDFSHVEVVFHLHGCPPVDRARLEPRRPRDNARWPAVGIFAQRHKRRPNGIGLTMATIVAREPRALVVERLDANDRTPVIDLKPVMRAFLPAGEVREPRWAGELMREYWSPPSS